jgi:hypothetical protein
MYVYPELPIQSLEKQEISKQKGNTDSAPVTQYFGFFSYFPCLFRNSFHEFSFVKRDFKPNRVLHRSDAGRAVVHTVTCISD